MDDEETGAGWISTEEWLLLADLLFSGRPRGIAEVVSGVTRGPARQPAEGHRHPEGRRGVERQQRLVAVFLRLCRRGLIVEAVPAGKVTSEVYRLSSAGRQAVTRAARLWLAGAAASKTFDLSPTVAPRMQRTALTTKAVTRPGHGRSVSVPGRAVPPHASRLGRQSAAR